VLRTRDNYCQNSSKTTDVSYLITKRSMLKHEVGLEGGRVVDNCQLHALWVVDCSFVLCF